MKPEQEISCVRPEVKMIINGQLLKLVHSTWTSKRRQVASTL